MSLAVTQSPSPSRVLPDPPGFTRKSAIHRVQKVMKELGLDSQSFHRSGGYSRVYRLFDQKTGREEAVKLLHCSEKTEELWRYASKELKKEIRALEKIHREREVKCVIPRPQEVYRLGKGNWIVGVRTEWYANDFFELTDHVFPKFHSKYTLPLLRSCIAPLAELHSQERVWGDMKLENILYRLNGEVALCDLSSVTHRSEMKLSVDPTRMLGSHTKDYLCWDDLFALIHISQRYSLGPGREEELLEEMWSLRRGMDIYAFGMVVLNLITGEHGNPMFIAKDLLK